MRLTFIAIGSRGDTQPYLALALGLRAVGYSVCLCAGDNFEAWVRGYGLEFVPLGVDIAQFMQKRIPDVLESGRNPVHALHRVTEEALGLAEKMWQGVERACANADAIGASLLGFGASCWAELHGIPFFLLHSTPLVGRTRTAPHPFFPTQRSMGAFWNARSHQLAEWALHLLLRPVFNRWRDQLALRRLGWRGWGFEGLPHLAAIPMLFAHSPSVVPRPFDWPPHWQVSGYWFLDRPADWQPPPDLEAFLGAGPAPVYIGFGSLSNRDPDRLTRLVVAALQQSDQEVRAVLATGWGGLAAVDIPGRVITVDSIPHDWLFPRMAAVIHHGGAGTTAAGLRAGVPSVIISHFGDQYFWGERLRALGVGVVLPRRKLTPERLTSALRHVLTDATLQRRSEDIAGVIRSEQGVQRAVEIIDRALNQGVGSVFR